MIGVSESTGNSQDKLCVFVSHACYVVFFFFKQKTAYEIKECDLSSDVCSSDLVKNDARRASFITFLAEIPFSAPDVISFVRRSISSCHSVSSFGFASSLMLSMI